MKYFNFKQLLLLSLMILLLFGDLKTIKKKLTKIYSELLKWVSSKDKKKRT